MAFVISVILIRQPQNTVESHHIHFETKELSKIQWGVFITPIILTFVLAFGLSSFETLFSIYFSESKLRTWRYFNCYCRWWCCRSSIPNFLFDKFMRYTTELTFITWALLYSVIVIFSLIIAHSYWSIMLISFIVFIGFDLIRPALTNYYSNIAGNRQGFAGGLNSTFTSMGNFVGPLVAGSLFDVNIEFPLYMSIIVMLFGIVIIFIEKFKVKS